MDNLLDQFRSRDGIAPMINRLNAAQRFLISVGNHYEPHADQIQVRTIAPKISGPECPEIKHIGYKGIGDEWLPYCQLNDTVCELEKGRSCPTWDEIQNEWMEDVSREQKRERGV